ncbi:GHKL domain-containing protein [Spirosoma sp. HMF4905]|uniref:histidine kinase n=1 Tax=Spirosoma arboris TaxID=2682092 RepID=A0A7K1SA90_9BACT|nr:ATP-binding protein [Spirosoma arboris]MVM30691.1 GHKL domain-containing protein [Spirosoma arboris]
MNRLLLWVIFAGLITNTAVGQGLRIVSESNLELGRSSWRFMPGDNKRWADSAFNDRSWKKQPIETTIELNDTIWRKNQGWFRQTLHPGATILKKDLRLVVKQFGASEIYLDGRLFAVLTPPRFDSGGSQRLIRFVPIRFTDTNQHILAVRYRFRRDPIVQASTDISPLSIHPQEADEIGVSLVDETQWPAVLSGCMIGVCGILALLHYLFYRANRSQPINRTLAWAMLFFMLAASMAELNDFVGTLTYVSLTDLIGDVSLHAGFVLLLTGVYQYLHLRRRWIYYGILTIVFIDQLYRTGIGSLLNEFGWVPLALVIIDYIRVSWLGRKTKDVDARLPWNSLKASLYCFLLIIVCGLILGLAESLIKDMIEYILVVFVLLVAGAIFSIPVGLSLSLVRDYTRTYKALGNNLREVEQLSARTLAQEQEKQHLLARQNELLEEQVQARTAELHQSLEDLRATQEQLVQREKLASLGELTAGIAHEIQNPLNFVNNFAEVSVELVEELHEEREKPEGERDKELETDLLSDLGQNVQKISDHGKRAANIVRGMLQHSRTRSGQKQPTDLNALVDEYLRLAYQGLRAKDKSFNAHLTTRFAPTLPAVNIVPEDIGRVLVNLFNNAFYAVQQKSQSELDFVPTVSVQTAQDDNQLVIRIRDNGTGIPDEVRQKVFQPFFTTKPTGQGTGLGLSLSYDIVVKGHGGLLKVETEPGEFTEFTITLPVE